MTTLSYNELSVDLHPTGARTTALRFHGRDLMLEMPRDADPHGPWAEAGAIVGPVAGRVTTGPHVAGWDGPENVTLLHGNCPGITGGVQHRTWRIARSGARFATFTLDLPAGCDGFAANRRLSVTYTLRRANALHVAMEARTDAPAALTLSHHPYWALGPGTGTEGHRLQILADHVLPTDAERRPTGEVAPVVGTAYDFNIPRTFPPDAPPLDNCFALAWKRRDVMAPAAFLEAPDGWAMELWTTEPGLVAYDGGGAATMGLAPHAGCCLEPQFWPDAPGHAHFPKIVLAPGEASRAEIEYRFKVGSGKMRDGGTSRGL